MGSEAMRCNAMWTMNAGEYEKNDDIWMAEKITRKLSPGDDDDDDDDKDDDQDEWR